MSGFFGGCWRGLLARVEVLGLVFYGGAVGGSAGAGVYWLWR